uniref:Glycosyltransferase family 2 protein n=1 Tax=Haemonchus placei TaxID=6290 RepID=A0A0N4WY04_HAEPC
LDGWNLVVVADVKTPKDWHLDAPGVHFLSQVRFCLGFRITTLLPENSYTRKNVGYLYAIQMGAKWIYDTDDDNKPFGKDSSCKLFNPYRFFGHPVMWPRGFPLEHLKGHSNGKGRLRLCRSIRTPAVQQGLVHKDPDVDAIYRLLYADKKTGLNESFSKLASPIVLSSGTYSPWNSQNTLFHRSAFFTLFLPISVAFRVTDIWRSYFSQKLLHLIGERIAFYPPNAIQNRNAHDYLSDFKQEKQLYESSGRLVEYLDSWRCFSSNIAECAIKLAENDLRAIG